MMVQSAAVEKQVPTEAFYISTFSVDGVTVPLYDAEEPVDGTKVSIVIGANGSGKSTVVAALVDELNALHADINGLKLDRTRRRAHTDFSVTYRVGSDVCSFERSESFIKAILNGKQVRPIDLPFPKMAFVVAHLPTDKFRFSVNGPDDFYRYLGLRQATNLTTTGALETKIVNSLIQGFGTSTFSQSLDHWLELLGLDGRFEIEFKGIKPELFEVESLQELLATLEPKSKKAAEESGLRPNTLASIGLTPFIEEFQQSVARTASSQSTKLSGTVDLKMISNGNDDELRNRWETGIDKFRRLGLIRKINLIVGKKGQRFPFSELSSGEQQILGTVTRLLSAVKPQSLIVIDEPEASLHPSWQIRYIPTLLDALKSVPNLHIVVATHSHFMVSDADSRITSLTRAVVDESEVRKFEIYDGDVYGRSPENILYRVFGVGSAGNFFVENDLAKALTIISNNDASLKPELRAILRRLEPVSGSDNPAFMQIVAEIKDFLLGGNDVQD